MGVAVRRPEAVYIRIKSIVSASISLSSTRKGHGSGVWIKGMDQSMDRGVWIVCSFGALIHTLYFDPYPYSFLVGSGSDVCVSSPSLPGVGGRGRSPLIYIYIYIFVMVAWWFFCAANKGPSCGDVLLKPAQGANAKLHSRVKSRAGLQATVLWPAMQQLAKFRRCSWWKRHPTTTTLIHQIHQMLKMLTDLTIVSDHLWSPSRFSSQVQQFIRHDSFHLPSVADFS